MDVYDVLRRLVDRAQWGTEAEQVDAVAAVETARQAELFGKKAGMIAPPTTNRERPR